MHAAVASTPQGQLFYWNVDAAVGLNGANKFDDVLFVQWCFYKMSTWQKITPDQRGVYRNTPINGQCSGREGDLLITSIKTL